MSQLTIADLAAILQEATGTDEAIEDFDTFASADFADLGYDSLALLEVASRLQRECGVTIDDAEMTDLRTPGNLLALVRSRSVGVA